MTGRGVIVAVSAVLVVAAAVVAVALVPAQANGTAEPAVAVTAPPVPTTAVPSPDVPPSASSTPPPSPSAPVTAPLAGRIAPGVSHSGVATFYDADGGGACGYDPGPDPLTAAMNAADFEGSKACGASVRVQAGGASVTVRITNLCPAPCRAGQLDLSPAAFDRLGARARGEIPVTWTLASSPPSKRISLRYKTGSSQYWCGIQVIDHRNSVARLEVRAGGGWKQLPRTDYNYFLSENGTGCGGAVAVTDIYGERLVFDPLPIEAGVVQPTNRQFAGH